MKSLAFVACCFASALAGASELSRDGAALMPVVVAADASPAMRAVADELAGFLGRIAGGGFKVVDGEGASGIVLGTLAQFPDAALDEPLAMRGFEGREAYVIRCDAKRVRLIGATDLGASHAAFRLLEELGCRWYFPAPEWEIVPSSPDISVDLAIDDRPKILARSVWFEAGSGGHQQNVEYVAWRRRNRQAESFQVNAGHNLDKVIYRNQALFDQHPEYYALCGGVRNTKGHHIEHGNPAVRELVVQYALDFFREHPHAEMVSLEPADSREHSQSPETQALGGVVDALFTTINQAAKALQREHPGKMIGLYSYNLHWDPPSFQLEPNVHVQLTPSGQGRYTPAERERVWPMRTRNLGRYDYFSVWLWSYDHLPGSWVNDVHGAQAAFRERIEQGVNSISAESTSSWGSNGRGYYIANKLMWDPEFDLEATLTEFYELAFGDGAEAMRRYYDRLDPRTQPLMSKHLLGQCFRDVDEAARLTEDRDDVQARLDQLKLYLRYVDLDWRMNREPLGQLEKDGVWTKIMTNLYRTRFMHLTSWEMIRQNWGKGLGDPTQALVDWMVEEPYTREEIEADFQEGLEFFQPRSDIGERVSFSNDVIAVDWGDLARGVEWVENHQRYQGGQDYVFWSVAGEPLEFTTWAGNAWGGVNRFSVTAADGTLLMRGDPANDTTMEHRIPVPGPGRYHLDYDDGGSHWAITVPAGKIVTLPTGSKRDFRHMEVMRDMWFYVPKGTVAFQYYYSRTAFHPGGPHQVIGPEGEVLRDVDVQGDWVSVPVPPGGDGRLWRLRNAVYGYFLFNNAPNYLAASPQALLVPRELVERDGLKPLSPPGP